MVKKIWTIAWKDIRLRFSSWMEWLFFLILPVLFTFVLSGGTANTTDNRITLEVVNQAGTRLASDLVNTLEQSTVVRPVLVDLERAERDFSERRISAMLIIPAGFSLEGVSSTDLSVEIRQQPNNLNALAASQAVQAVVERIGSAAGIARSSVSEAEQIRPFASPEARQAYFDAALQKAQAQLDDLPPRYDEKEALVEDKVDYDPRANSSAGQLITWAFIPLLGISGMFAYERQLGTLRRLLTTPTHKATFLAGTILGQVAVALTQMILLVGVGMLLLKLNWGHSPLALAVILVAAALAAAGLGVFLGTITKTEGQAGSLSWMLGMVMALLGGCWYPIELFPAFMQNAVKVLPTTWAMQGMLNIVLRGQGLEGVLLPAGVLVGFAAIFFTLGVWKFKY